MWTIWTLSCRIATYYVEMSIRFDLQNQLEFLLYMQPPICHPESDPSQQHGIVRVTDTQHYNIINVETPSFIL